MAEPPPIIPGFDEVQVDNKLWSFFESRMQEAAGKVEWEQVNCA